MKKTVVLMLFSLLLLVAVGVSAEQVPANVQTIDAMGAFKVMAKIPDGYDYSGAYVSDVLYVGNLIPKDSRWGRGIVTIAFDEEADGMSISDLPQNVIDTIVAEDVRTLGENVEFSEAKTTHGTRLLVYYVKDIEEERFEIYTLYQGYQIRFVVFPAQGQRLTSDHLKMAIDFVSEVWITK